MAEGIEVYRQLSPYVMQSYEYLYGENPFVAIGGVAVEHGLWYPADVARARDLVIEKARLCADEEGERESRALYRALADLDAAEGGVGT